MDIALSVEKDSKKIVFNSSSQQSNCCCFICCTSPYDCYLNIVCLSCQTNRIYDLQQAIITDSDLIIKRDKIKCCCCVQGSDEHQTIPLKTIENITINRCDKILNINYSKDSISYQLYKKALYTISVFGVKEPHQISQIILSRRDNIRDQSNYDKSKQISLNLLARILVIFIGFAILLTFSFLWNDYADSFMIDLKVKSIIATIWMDRIMILFGIINVFIIAFFMIKQHIKTSYNEQKIRSTLQPNLIPSKSLHILYTLLLFIILIYFMYRAVYVVFCFDNRCSLHLFFTNIFHAIIVSLLIDIYIYHDFQLLKYRINKGSWHFFIIFCIFLTFIGVLLSVTGTDGFKHDTYNYCIINKSTNTEALRLSVLGLSLFQYLYIFAIFQIYYITGIRKSQNKVFNQKLYNALYVNQQYIILWTISFIVLFVSLHIYEYIPMISSITFTVISWCICLMHKNHLSFYKMCCKFDCCLHTKSNRNLLHFENLYEEKPNNNVDDESVVEKLEINVELKTDDTNELTIISECSRSVIECTSINSLIETMMYYQEIIMSEKEEENDDEKNEYDLFVKYCHERPNLLEEYIHFVTSHKTPQDLNKIFNEIISVNVNDGDYNILTHCQMMDCSFLKRHFREEINKNNKDNNKENQEFIFYRNLMDTIHCLIYHFYDKTKRITQRQINDETMEEIYTTS